MSMKIVVPDDFPVVLTGSPAERRLRALGDVTIYIERGAEQETELVRRIGDAEVKVGTVRPQPLLKLPCRSNMLKQTGGRSRGGHPSRSL